MAIPQHPTWSDGTKVEISQRARTDQGVGPIVSIHSTGTADVQVDGRLLRRRICDLTRVVDWRKQYDNEIAFAREIVSGKTMTGSGMWSIKKVARALVAAADEANE